MAKVRQTNLDPAKLTVVKKKAPRKPPVMRDVQSVFRKHLRSIDIEKLKKPWMASKSFVLLDTEELLEAWVDSVLADKSRWVKPYADSPEPMPVVAVDTETIGLDTRILTHYRKEWHVTGNEVLVPVYEVKAEIAGVVLSVDGITGVYIPINHQGCFNVSREAANRLLQKLFDVSHLVFYNAKFDREVLRLTLALKLRDYPFYEDVQILNYINDPKADLGDDTFVTDGSGLKGLAKFRLNIEQIDLSSLTKVSAWLPWHLPTKVFEFLLEAEAKQAEIEGREIRPIPNQDKYIVNDKVSCRMQHVPFTWVPTNIAVWYAAADGITTWLLWNQLRHEAQSRKVVHTIDGNLIDTLTWLERQRTLIDTKPVARISKWHGATMAEKKDKLRKLAIEGGWIEDVDEDGVVIEDTVFDVGKPQKLSKLLYEIKRFKVVKRTPPSAKHPNGQPSTDADALLDLRKMYPEDPFLKELESYKEYVALHPDKLAFEPHDSTIRLYIKQSTVGGGRLAAAGGNFEKDGGFGMNPQAIKSVGGNWWVTGNVLEPDKVEEDDVIAYEEEDLHPSCIKEVDEDFITGWLETTKVEGSDTEVTTQIFETQFPENMNELPEDDPALFRTPVKEKRRVKKKAPGIINNHIGNYLGYSICLVPKCKSCKDKFGILMPNEKLDANQIVNFRQFFIAQPGWTFFTSDYSGIEMRVAANCLARETNILIKGKGFVPIGENLGTHTLLNSKGEWVHAEIKSFGISPLRRVRIGHNKWSKDIYATPSHRWILTNGSEVETDKLKNQDPIPWLCPQRKADYGDDRDYLLGVRHGIIYGDGSRSQSGRKGMGPKSQVTACKRTRGYRIRLCGEDKHLLKPFFEEFPVSYPPDYGGDCVVMMYDSFSATHELKELPREDETEAYLVGFMRGWFAADGHSGTGGVSLCCGVEEETWVRRVMTQFGFYFLGSSEITVDTYLCDVCGKQVKTTKKPKRNRKCRECLSDIRIDAPVVLKSVKFQRRDYQHKKRSKTVTLFRPSLMEADFLLPHKLAGFIKNRFELTQKVRTVEHTDRVEEVFCAVVPGTHDFVIENGILTGNCSGEPRYINEFIHGSGDFHTLTASVVFPEFNDPNTSKARRKELRSLAKIINFALQYGGTEYTIFSNMKTQKPDITWEEAKSMVRKYWEGVPVYKKFYDEMQRIAKEELTCTTVFGRVVKFASQMAGLGIHEPTKEEMDNYWTWVRLRKRVKQAEEANDAELLRTSQAHMDKLWDDKETGVRNAKLYNGFIGKIQRVSANIPSQGTAGDFMRIAMNYIRHWAASIEPLVQSVFLLHSTVHDELDYTVKNPYVPFVVPRVTRFMRLRKLHAKKNWPVPIECDTEYGHSWDVKHHVTGDLEHIPQAWTSIEGLENYIPEDFDEGIVESLTKALLSGKEKARQKVRDWMNATIHTRALEVSDVNLLTEDKDKLKHLAKILYTDDPKVIRHFLTVILQLHEYWTVDGVHYNDDATMETLEQYEARRGLKPTDRGFMPEMGYIGAVPLDKAIRPTLPILLPEPEPNILERIYAEYKAERDEKKRLAEERKAAKEGTLLGVDEDKVVEVTPEPVTQQQVISFTPEVAPEPEPPTIVTSPPSPEPEDDLFAPQPKRRIKEVEIAPQLPPPLPYNPKGLPVVRPLSSMKEFKEFIASLGIGTNKLVFLYGKREFEKECAVTEIPEMYRG